MIRKRHALVAANEWFEAILTAGYLKNAGYDTTVLHDGLAAYERMLAPEPLAVSVLATDLRRMNGLEIIHRTKAQGLDLPVVLVAPDPKQADAPPVPPGAICKPLRGTALAAKVRAVRSARRREPAKARRVRLGSLSVDFDTRAATRPDAAPIQLSAQETGLLQHLAHQHGRPVTLAEIATRLGLPESIARFLFELRWKLGAGGLNRHLRPVGHTACRLDDFEVLG